MYSDRWRCFNDAIHLLRHPILSSGMLDRSNDDYRPVDSYGNRYYDQAHNVHDSETRARNNYRKHDDDSSIDTNYEENPQISDPSRSTWKSTRLKRAGRSNTHAIMLRFTPIRYGKLPKESNQRSGEPETHSKWSRSISASKSRSCRCK